MKARLVSFLLGVVALVVLAYADACTPAQRALIPEGEKEVCVFLRAADPSLAPYCATADELAPFVPLLLEAAQARASAPGAPAPAPAVLAFSMPPPKRPAPRRRCAAWVMLDAGAEASPP